MCTSGNQLVEVGSPRRVVSHHDVNIYAPLRRTLEGIDDRVLAHFLVLYVQGVPRRTDDADESGVSTRAPDEVGARRLRGTRVTGKVVREHRFDGRHIGGVPVDDRKVTGRCVVLTGQVEGHDRRHITVDGDGLLVGHVVGLRCPMHLDPVGAQVAEGGCVVGPRQVLVEHDPDPHAAFRVGSQFRLGPRVAELVHRHVQCSPRGSDQAIDRAEASAGLCHEAVLERRGRHRGAAEGQKDADNPHDAESDRQDQPREEKGGGPVQRTTECSWSTPCRQPAPNATPASGPERDFSAIRGRCYRSECSRGCRCGRLGLQTSRPLEPNCPREPIDPVVRNREQAPWVGQPCWCTAVRVPLSVLGTVPREPA